MRFETDELGWIDVMYVGRGHRGDWHVYDVGRVECWLRELLEDPARFMHHVFSNVRLVR